MTYWLLWKIYFKKMQPCEKPVGPSDGEHNAWVYNTTFVPKITWFSLGDATISSKTDSSNSRKKDQRSYGKVRAMLKILSFIWILYFKQYSTLQSFCSLKFEEIFLCNRFLSFILGSKMIVHKAEKEPIKIFCPKLAR